MNEFGINTYTHFKITDFFINVFSFIFQCRSKKTMVSCHVFWEIIVFTLIPVMKFDFF